MNADRPLVVSKFPKKFGVFNHLRHFGKLTKTVICSKPVSNQNIFFPSSTRAFLLCFDTASELQAGFVCKSDIGMDAQQCDKTHHNAFNSTM